MDVGLSFMLTRVETLTAQHFHDLHQALKGFSFDKLRKPSARPSVISVIKEVGNGMGHPKDS
jgi:hypothetical protein